MKKNKMMRIASVLLIAVLMTTCAISGTFAKYVTSAEGEDSARVAKWGVTITANGETFAEKYNDAPDAAGTKVVSSVSAENVLAPGTNGSLAAMTLSGTPEVAVNVTYEATLVLNYWTLADTTEYCPIVFTVNGATYGTNDTDATNKSANIAALVVAVESAIEAYSANYAANQNLATESTVATPDVSWSWAFYTDNAHDVKDTYLGDKAAAGTAPEITLTIKTTVTQVD